MIGATLRAFLRLMTFQLLFSEYRWYRRLYGGRWECHWIDICGSDIWLPMDPMRCWPHYRQPCSRGTPVIEDWHGGPGCPVSPEKRADPSRAR